MDLSPGDPHSHSRPDLVAVTHTRLELTVDFDRQVLKGKATLRIEKKISTCNELILDNYELKIFSVTDPFTGESFITTIENADKFGSKFIIELPNTDLEHHKNKVSNNERNRYQIQIKYETSPRSPALYWLRREQTSDGAHPLLISDSKLTYTRAIFPCQDTPSNKIKFDSEITVSRGLNVMMPGLKQMGDATENNTNKYIFSGTEIIPPYAIHIIVGSLREVREHKSNIICNLWTEEKYFEQGEKTVNKIVEMLCNIKESCGFSDAVNMCILPPNMPEFIIQYPFVTYVSSNLLSDECSMINEIIYSVIESWMVKIITIKNFRHLWIIKSLSTFTHRTSINGIMVDKNHYTSLREFLEDKGYNNMLNMKRSDASLVPSLTNVLPSAHYQKDGIKHVLFEKGYCLLKDLLQVSLLERHSFQLFLSDYLLAMYCKSEILTTDRFKNDMCKRFRAFLTAVTWDRWLYGVLHIPNRSIRKFAFHFVADWWMEQKKIEISLGTMEKPCIDNDIIKIEFLSYIHASPTNLPEKKLKTIKSLFSERIKEIREMKFLWLRLCIKSRDFKSLEEAKESLEEAKESLEEAKESLEEAEESLEEAKESLKEAKESLKEAKVSLEEVLKFACEYCSPKYACPIFRDLYELDEKTRNFAKSWFLNACNRTKMLPETINELLSILGVVLDDRA